MSVELIIHCLLVPVDNIILKDSLLPVGGRNCSIFIESFDYISRLTKSFFINSFSCTYPSTGKEKVLKSKTEDNVQFNAFITEGTKQRTTNFQLEGQWFAN